MTDFSPNNEQRELIESVDGIYKVDAGAGTGKTFTITRRYAHILEHEDVEPEDILLLTFTNNAAEEMKERIINHCSYDMKALREAPISTFHSLAKDIITQDGFETPKYLGIDDYVTTSTDLIENDMLERQEFRDFVNGFIEENPEYSNFFRVLNDYTALLGLVKSLAAKGVVPTADGWYRNSERYLEGDFDEFMSIFNEMNEPGVSSRGNPTQSDMFGKVKSNFAGANPKYFEPGSPEFDVLNAGKKVNPEYGEKAFYEEREELKQFIHDVYFEYLEYCLSRNYLNFNFLMVLAFVLLCEDSGLREELSFEYSMIDEFQDTNEIQFKTAMLLSEGNLAVVGDWKQSIYSFQYANVDNITEFRERLKNYKQELNEESKRVKYNVSNVKEIDLKINYRSSQKILDFSEDSLRLPGKQSEDVTVRDEIVSLEAEQTGLNTSVNKFKSEDEIEAVLERIQEVVGNEEYRIDGSVPEYSDIAVLTRTRSFGLELKEKAEDYDIPVSTEGRTELFNTEPGIILLAWLRVLDYKESRKGWAVILEEAGYNMAEIKYILNENDFPENMEEFVFELEELDDVSAVARKVFSRYGIDNGFTDRIIQVLQDVFDSSYMNTGELVGFIEECIEEGETFQVDDSRGESVTVQTIHSAKGLEYPIVFVSDINSSRFPSKQSNNSRIMYEEPVGLRQKKAYSSEEGFLYDNWQEDIVSNVLSGNYDEERRLMYVAMTRAEQHLFFSAETGRESTFFDNLGIDVEEVEPELTEIETVTDDRKELEVEEVDERAPVKKSVHAAMDLDKDVKGRGKEFGKKVHEFAEKYANGEKVEPRNKDEEKVKQFIDSLEGELRPEVPIKVPVIEDGRKIVYHGVIDLLHITDDKVEIIDWKTDLSRENHGEYEKQLEIYEKGAREYFGEEVENLILYTEDSISDLYD